MTHETEPPLQQFDEQQRIQDAWRKQQEIISILGRNIEQRPTIDELHWRSGSRREEADNVPLVASHTDLRTGKTAYFFAQGAIRGGRPVLPHKPFNVLAFTDDEYTAFIDGVKNSEFDIDDAGRSADEPEAQAATVESPVRHQSRPLQANVGLDRRLYIGDEPLPEDLLVYHDKLRHQALISEAMQFRRMPVDSLPWRVSSRAANATHATGIAMVANPDTNTQAWFLTKVELHDGKPVVPRTGNVSVSAFSQEEWNAFVQGVAANDFADKNIPVLQRYSAPVGTNLNIDAERNLLLPHEEDAPEPGTPQAIGAVSLTHARPSDD